MTTYARTCKKCNEQMFLINPNKGDIIKCDKCGATHRVGMRPFVILEPT